MRQPVFGMVAEFGTSDELVTATRKAKDRGFKKLEAFTPLPVPELEEIIGHTNWLPFLVLGAGVTGALTGYGLQYYIAVLQYPINVGGRPLHSWPAFVVITFELTVLFAAIASFLFAVAFGSMPTPYHPTGNVPGFEESSREKFFLFIDARDALFDRLRTAEFLAELNPERVDEVAH
jgi:hypothetical protein